MKGFVGLVFREEPAILFPNAARSGLIEGAGVRTPCYLRLGLPMHLRLTRLIAISILALAGVIAGSSQGLQTPDAQAAASLLTKANQGDVAAQIAIGESYLQGSGVERDCKQAGDWFRKAAERNAIAGEMRLASFLRDGAKGCPRDMVQAAAWYRKAAEQGDITAQGILGVLYSYGQGVAQDYIEAYFWLDVAASVPSSEQAHYAANRQMVGVHLTTDDIEALQVRASKWKSTHPH